MLWSTDGSTGISVPGLVLVMQRVAGYQPPAWPGSSLVHLDLPRKRTWTTSSPVPPGPGESSPVSSPIHAGGSCSTRPATRSASPQWPPGP
jgi:hypothetical protein